MAAKKTPKPAAVKKPAPPKAATTAAITISVATGPLSSDAKFFYAEGAHFDDNYEIWEVSGRVTDGAGGDWDFHAVFHQSGGLYMNMRTGFNSLHPAATDTYYFTASAAPAIKNAALKILKDKLKRTPARNDLKAAIERIEKDETPHFKVFTETADIFRTLLHIKFGKDRFERISKDRFEYLLDLDVQGNRLTMVLGTEKDPVNFDFGGGIPVGTTGAKFHGYEFPNLKISGMFITSDNKVKVISGAARFLHLWGSPDSAAFSKYSYISQTLDDGSSFYSFVFSQPEGKPLSSHTVLADASGKTSVDKSFSLTELESWTSKSSNIKYPLRWSAKSDGLEGELSLTDKLHEISILEGVGAFHAGPCEFKGKSHGKKVTGQGDCHLVGVEKK